MSKTTNTLIFTAIAILILGGFGYFFLKPNSSSSLSTQSNSTINSTNSTMSKNENMGMMDGMNMSSMNGDSMNMTSMSDVVKDDQSFLENMIPHHEEAVTSSNQILASTQDSELKTFAQNVITAQTKEITDMRSWYKTWFNKDYVPNTNYQAMMGGMNGKTGVDLDKEYIKGMIMHHQGAIQMANKIQAITKRPELINLANDIIASQSKERTTLMGWMMSKYNDHTMMGM